MYTSNPNEVETKNTVPAPGDVMAMLKANWPELADEGARTLTAQFEHETGGGRFCFNWNLGNVKAQATDPHMYLRNVWELLVPADAQKQVADALGLARIASEQECKQHGWSHPPDKAVVVFTPPHAQCRFRAYANLADGAARWVGLHKRIAGQQPNYLATVNSGDCAAVAHILKAVHYYSGDETVYARSMAAKKAALAL